MTQFYRCANRLNESYVLSAFEYCPAKPDGWVVQSLLGRSCGWGKQGLTWVFSNVAAAQRYLAWMQHDCQYGLVEYTGASIRTVPGGTSFIQRARGAASTRYSERTDACVDELTRPSISAGERARIRRQRLRDHLGELRSRQTARRSQMGLPPAVDFEDRVEPLAQPRVVLKLIHIRSACASGLGLNAQAVSAAWSEVVFYVQNLQVDWSLLLPSASGPNEQYVASMFRPAVNLFLAAHSRSGAGEDGGGDLLCYSRWQQPKGWGRVAVRCAQAAATSTTRAYDDGQRLSLHWRPAGTDRTDEQELRADMELAQASSSGVVALPGYDETGDEPELSVLLLFTQTHALTSPPV